jgi:uncharacterized alkaline shock family protein YloU
MPEIINSLFGRSRNDNSAETVAAPTDVQTDYSQPDATDVVITDETGGTNAFEVKPADTETVDPTDEDATDAEHVDDADDADDAEDATDAEDDAEDAEDADDFVESADAEDTDEDESDLAADSDDDNDDDQADDETAVDEATDEDSDEAASAEDLTEEDAADVTDEDSEPVVAEADEAPIAAVTDVDDVDDVGDVDQTEPVVEAVIELAAEPAVQPAAQLTTVETRPTAGTRGTITVGEGVVAKVANIVVSKIDGVHSFDGEGISVEVEDDIATIRVALVLEYGHAIKALAEQIRTGVIEAVEQFLGLEVAFVDVHVSDIHPPA